MFQRNPINAGVLFALTAMPVAAWAAAEQTLPAVVVTAESEPETASGYRPVVSRSSTKTDTPLLNTPQSVSVVASQQIKDQAIQSMAEAVRYTPGVNFAQGEGNRDAAVIRGSTSTGDFYLDGVRDDVQYYRDVYNIDRVEVLKGSNGLAFGRGGAGGVINRISKEATWKPLRELGVSVGTNDHKRATVDVGGPLSERVAGRVNAVTEDSESYRDGASLRRNGLSPTLTLLPGDNTKVVLSAEYFNDLRTADRGVPSRLGKPLRTDESTFFGNVEQSPTETTVRGVGASIEHRFDNGVMLSNKTRYADYDKYYKNVFASGSVNALGNFNIQGYIDDTQRENLFNQTDVSFKFATGDVKHNLVTGVELGRQDSKNSRFDARFGATCASKTTSANVSNPKATAVAFDCLARRSETNVDVFSVYAQDQIDLSKNWQAVVGVRQDQFETEFTNFVTPANSGNAKDKKRSPRLALIYKPSEPVSIYASYSKTFQPRAGDQLSSFDKATGSLEPEEFINHELGVKWDITPDMSVTAAVYRLNRNNVATVDPVTPANRILADGQRVQGAELGFNGKLSSAWSVVGGYSFADSEITKDPDAAGAIKAGNETSQTPRHTFSVWNRYDLNDKYGVGLGVISRSEMFALDDNAVRLPGYARVDAAFFMKASRNLDLQLNIENLTSRDYTLNAHNNNNIMPGSPIAARLSASYRF